MPDTRGIQVAISNRRPVLTDDPEYDRLLLEAHAENPSQLQPDERAYAETLLAGPETATFRSQNDPAADRARLGMPENAPYASTMGQVLNMGGGPTRDPRSEAKNPEATPGNDTLAKFRGLMVERQPSQVPMDRRPSTIRAATGGERVGAYVQSLLGLLAKQPVGRVTDAFGMTGLDAMANRPAPSTTIAMMPDLPGRKMAHLLEGETARALTGGFYSRVDEAAKLLPPKGVKAESLINTLKKASGGVSAEELELRGLAEFAASKRGQVVTPADLAAHLKANPAPFPTVKTLGGRKTVLHSPEGRPVPPFPATKFSQYQVPGGEKYRETLLTLPKKSAGAVPPVTGSVRKLEAGERGFPGFVSSVDENPRSFSTFSNEDDAIADAAKRASYQTELKQLQADRAIRYSSTHFDEPNIVAHTRSNERTSPTGERGTFLEEVQSDWHQAGKQGGYFTSESQAPDTSGWTVVSLPDQGGAGGWRVMDANGELLGRVLPGTPAGGGARNAEEAIAHVAGNQNTLTRNMSVPDAPFKENWPDLSLKQALIDEANRSPDPGFLGFTGGKTQAARYDLSKQVGKVEADLYDIAGDNNWRLKAWDINGNQLPISNQYLTDTELADHIGKDMARKIIADKGGVYTGLDLQVGGEGMHEFYDKLLPKRLEKIVKPFGGSVERGEILGAPLELQHTGRGRIVKYPQPEPAWLSRLTPEIKARILKEGLPLMGLSGLTLGNLLGQEQEPVR